MTPYVTKTELKETLNLAAEQYADDDIDICLAAASKQVDDVCGRTFNKDTTDKVRVFPVRRPRWVLIADLLPTPTAIEVSTNGTSYTALGNYELTPLNAEDNAQPYEALELLPNASDFDTGSRVRVTGKFGWPAVPDSVKVATSLVATRLLKRTREAPFGVAGIGGDGVAVRIARTDPDVQMLLNGFQRSTRLA